MSGIVPSENAFQRTGRAVRAVERGLGHGDQQGGGYFLTGIYVRTPTGGIAAMSGDTPSVTSCVRTIRDSSGDFVDTTDSFDVVNHAGAIGEGLVLLCIWVDGDLAPVSVRCE